MKQRVFRAEVFLRMNAFAEVVGPGGRGLVGGGAFHAGRKVDERAHQAAEGFVEVHQELVPMLVERAKLVFVVFEERRVIVGRFEGVPMQVAPVAVVGDADVPRGTFRRVGLHGGYSQCQRAVGRGNGAAVAVRLFHVVLVLLHAGAVITVQFRVILHGG